VKRLLQDAWEWFVAIVVGMLVVTFFSGVLTLVGVFAEGTAPCPFCILLGRGTANHRVETGAPCGGGDRHWVKTDSYLDHDIVECK
jgi:hypothetical protein